MPSSIESIANLLNVKRIGTCDANIDWILTDSRSLCFAEETLFFALKTKRNDGHKYIPELYERGVRNFVVSDLPQDMEKYVDANFLQTPFPLKALQTWQRSIVPCSIFLLSALREVTGRRW